MGRVIYAKGSSFTDDPYLLYINDPVASISRPVKELKGFKKVFLQSGEKKEVSFIISPEDLKFYNSDLKYDWEPRDFSIFMGTNSFDLKLLKLIG